MVWESGCVVIVMLTPLSENGVKQCHHYWPDEGSDVYHIYEVCQAEVRKCDSKLLMHWKYVAPSFARKKSEPQIYNATVSSSFYGIKQSIRKLMSNMDGIFAVELIYFYVTSLCAKKNKIPTGVKGMRNIRRVLQKYCRKEKHGWKNFEED